MLKWTTGFIAISALITLSYQGCGDVSFQKDRKTSSVQDGQGSTPVGERKCDAIDPAQHKFLYVVDQSGSNKNRKDDYGNPLIGNDDTVDSVRKPKRVESIRDFLRMHKERTDFMHSLVTFADDRARFRTRDENNNRVFTNDLMLFDEGLSEFQVEDDDENTPYEYALRRVRDFLKNEIEADEGVETIYNVFFVSDGFPNSGASEGPVQEGSEILRLVKEIRDLKKNFVFLNTVYYAIEENDPERKALEGLSLMARDGNGSVTDIPEPFDVRIQFDEIRERCE